MINKEIEDRMNKQEIVTQAIKKGKMSATKKEKSTSDNKLLSVIRISGMVGVNKDIAETLDRLRLRRKYVCVLINSNKNNEGMLKKIKFYIAYGEIDKNTLVKLIKERAKSAEGDKNKIKINVEDVADSLIKGKKLSDFMLKPFFRLHPPRKGIKSKLAYPKGVLGNNGKDINKLIERML